MHAGLLHILFNMMAVRQLAPAVADMYGAARMVIIYVLAGGAGFILSSLGGYYLPGVPFIGGGGITLGASASVSGLVGAILYYGRRSGSSMAHQYATQTALMLAAFFTDDGQSSAGRPSVAVASRPRRSGTCTRSS